MHDRRIADIERALIAGEECSGAKQQASFSITSAQIGVLNPGLHDVGRNAACTRWSWSTQDTH